MTPPAPTGAPPLLVVDGLVKAFGGVRAVDGVSFVLRAGESAALIGPNGAGKSTLFSLIACQRRPDAGTVRMEGRLLTGRPAHALAGYGIGRTFQIARAFSSLGVFEAARTAARVGLPRAEADRRAGDLIARLGLTGLADATVATLSYGDIKRLELAIALAGRCRLLLMDEPAAGMAPAERRALMDLVGALAAEEGVTVLFTEHDMDVVFGHARRVMVLHHGRLIADGSPERIRADSRVRSVYLGESAGTGNPLDPDQPT
ncbi:ABC transporter ATP-binding protein [Rhodospirillum rubrum]|uniref:ABC transporter ATP-binding protein n=1 Tax=Rhodospirillum rubrum TaxID=1085 RepID=UPI0019066CB0|nr:ABC transporter ATP-binding protein [Rhodospirillum rubrum]MBK1664435.1 ABC transporter ATP-binding protein [Rhodospirillum rubrum]MBK1675309.1 ABC transporter ATP-binding protein [Rhodospirillum rubrum]